MGGWWCHTLGTRNLTQGRYLLCLLVHLLFCILFCLLLHLLLRNLFCLLLHLLLRILFCLLLHLLLPRSSQPRSSRASSQQPETYRY